IDEKTVKTQNTMTAMFNSGAGGTRGTQSIASPSFLEGDYLYTSTFKLGPRLYANDGSSKAMVQKYDIKTGKQLWQSDKLSKGTDLSFASSDFVFVRKGKAFGKSALFVLDAKTGKLLTETETIDGFVYREGAGDVLTPSFLYRGGKKNVYAFSTQSWKMVKTYNTKSEKAGKLQVMIPASSQLLTVGDKGLIFFDGQGKSENAVNTPRVTGTYWNDTYCFLFTTKKTVAVNLDTQEMAGELSLFPTENTFFLFSADGSKMVTIQNGNSLVLFNN
ncbi:MAG: PQQ-binding-like beta-propeller repeat protein, partial [Bacteroidota bacterium]